MICCRCRLYIICTSYMCIYIHDAVLNHIILLVSKSLFCYRNAVNLTVTANVIQTNSLQSISYCCEKKHIAYYYYRMSVYFFFFFFKRNEKHTERFVFASFSVNFRKPVKAEKPVKCIIVQSI